MTELVKPISSKVIALWPPHQPMLDRAPLPLPPLPVLHGERVGVRGAHGWCSLGLEKLGEATGAPPKSLIRMFGPRGNPQARNLFNVIGYLQKRAGLQLHVTGYGVVQKSSSFLRRYSKRTSERKRTTDEQTQTSCT